MRKKKEKNKLVVDYYKLLSDMRIKDLDLSRSESSSFIFYPSKLSNK